MLPSLLSREIAADLAHFLSTAFPSTTAGFDDEQGRGPMQRFLDDSENGNLLKGPWLEVRLPFRVGSKSDSPMENIDLVHAPYHHQLQAYQRLTGASPQSTIVATGTGSGKTECFLYPILDYCLRNNTQRGIKALIIYPMNALAADQARRFAHEIDKDKLKLSVGMYTGDTARPSARMTADSVITDRKALQDNPPDILLTNYKMLDLLLLRPGDQRIWELNRRTIDLLRYLVVDELHTFDGAQGTDLACLIRRLRDKLSLGKGLACVGTSATMGEDSGGRLLEYARQIFATDFDENAIIRENRLTVEEYVQSHAGQWEQDEMLAHWPEPDTGLLPGDGEDQNTYLKRQAALWLDMDLPLDSKDKAEHAQACVALGQGLHRHVAFRSLLQAASRLVDVRQLAEQWAADFALHDVGHARALIDSLTALVSTARMWGDLETRSGLMPLLHVRGQLWLRELRRMVASVEAVPVLRHADDVSDAQAVLHLPLVHCRECHQMAWGALQPKGEHAVATDLQQFYQRWFGYSPDTVLLYPLAADQPVPVLQRSNADHSTAMPTGFCPSCRGFREEGAQECIQCSGPVLRVWKVNPVIERRFNRGKPNETTRLQRTDHCPHCLAEHSLVVLGSAAASLASVMINRLFGSAFNQDHKLIAFSDSVQDAAHRAGFFGARTYQQTLRQAMALFLRDAAAEQALSLQAFVDGLPDYWMRNSASNAEFVGRFIGPNMLWLDTWRRLVEEGGNQFDAASQQLPHPEADLGLVAQVGDRLRWEALVEVGLRSGIGRTLERTGFIHIQPDAARVQATAAELMTAWGEESGHLRELDPDAATDYLTALLQYWRRRGALYDRQLKSYLDNDNKPYVLGIPAWMPSYGRQSKVPISLGLEGGRANHDNLLARGSASGSSRPAQLFAQHIAVDDHVMASADYRQAMQLLLRVLLRNGWLVQKHTARGDIYMLRPDAWTLTLGAQHAWNTVRPVRLVPREHTALIDDNTRMLTERSFIRGRQAWDVNLLSATPTLEMGIDIGKLSAVLLCSVPPTQANYLQRIGRAGRTNGNALALAIATGRDHDNYFYQQPLEMIAGEVDTPGVYLEAMAVLERQLIAYCFDRWASSGVDESAIPRRLGNVLDGLGKADGRAETGTGRVFGSSPAGSSGSFPANFLDFVARDANRLHGDFLRLFPDMPEDGRAHLAAFISESPADLAAEQPTDPEQDVMAGHAPLAWRIVNRLRELRNSRDSLRASVNAINRRIYATRRLPEDDARNKLLDALQQEKRALNSVVNGINRKNTFNFMTDEGLLPNYAFPEEGVTLQSVLMRRRTSGFAQAAPDAASDAASDATPRKDMEYVDLSFQRSARAALGELVPDSEFYAAEHRIRIQRVDLRLSEPELWRLCPDCNHSRPIPRQEDDAASVCPRCGSAGWAGISQKRTLLKLRQVFAFSSSRRDRIADDADQRQPRFFQRQLLIDIEPADCERAILIDDEQLPFGFEFVRKARLRDINFGELSADADSYQVAGISQPRQGFTLCRHCGAVKGARTAPDDVPHALDCRLRQPGAKETPEDYFESLYLYRELHSEAIRILLPLADVAQSERRRHSLIAAINLGLEQFFGGKVDHLQVSEMTEPGEGVARQYLVIHDNIPGGTGYLKQLMLRPGEMFSMLEKARDVLAGCSCVNDDTRDGCYRCILAYRSSRHQRFISRAAACELLDRILAARDNLKEVPTLAQVSIDHVLESELEARFVNALTRLGRLSRYRWNNKPAYRLQLTPPAGATVAADDDHITAWLIEPQVTIDLPALGTHTRADFVLRPMKAHQRRPDRELLIYTDGFGPHRENVSDDVRLRMALHRQGHAVWVLGWRELDDIETDTGDIDAARELVTPTGGQAAQIDALWHELAQKTGWAGVRECQDLWSRSRFNLLADWLHDPDGSRRLWQQAAIYRALQHALPAMKQQGNGAAAARQLEDDPHAWIRLALDDWHTRHEPYEHHHRALLAFAAMVPRTAMANGEQGLASESSILIAVDDTALDAGDASLKAWGGFWHAFNLLQFAPVFHAVAWSSLRDGDPEALSWPSGAAGAPQTSDTSDTAAAGWADVRDFLDEPGLEVATQLEQAGLPAPDDAGREFDLGAGGRFLEAEMVWTQARVALFLQALPDALPPSLEGWQVVSVAGEGWPRALSELLNREDADV